MKQFRKIIQIKATDSPNVRLGLEERARGLIPSDRLVIPGVKSYSKYAQDLKTLDPIRLKINLDAEFYEGSTVKLVPEDWLDAAEKWHGFRPEAKSARYMGVDPGEGGDDTCWCVGDLHGVLEMVSEKTPDTNRVYGFTLEMMQRHQIRPENVTFDLGGGGKEHADRLAAAGFQVRAVSFGGGSTKELKRGMTQFQEKKDVLQDRMAYFNRRSEMFYDIRLCLSRDSEGLYISWQGNDTGFALPKKQCAELRRQLSLIPLTYGSDGRFRLLPKSNPTDPSDPNTLKALIGRSPDQADAFACMLYGMTHRSFKSTAGASF